VAVIATMDRDHYDLATKAINLGYDLLLEKPIAPTPEECKGITDLAVEKGSKVIIGTVLRYTELFITLKQLLDSGKIGDIISINHEECVGNLHQSHSFVRGNWGNSERSSHMLLQKTCHDFDILQWLIGKKCKKVQSFGSLTYFTAKNAPEGATEFCSDGCPHAETCIYNAVKLYYDDKENDWFRTDATKIVNPSDEEVMNVLKTKLYGKCVYKCDNDVVDHQTVNMLFEDDITVAFTMNAFNKGGRFIHIMGTKGEIRAATDGETPITLYDFDTMETQTIDIVAADGMVNGHGGGDIGIVRTLYDYLTGDYKGASVPDINESCYSHMIVFAAEKARETGSIIDVDDYIKTVK